MPVIATGVSATRLEIANLAVTSISAFTTLAAVIIAVKALKTQVKAPSLERRASMYHSLIVLPALECLPAHEQQASALLEDGIQNIEELVERGASAKDARQASARLVKEYLALHNIVMYRIIVAARAWRDEPLKQQLTAALIQLFDDVSNGVDATTQSRAVEPSVADRLRDGVANVLAIIVHSDTADGETQPPRGRKDRHTSRGILGMRRAPMPTADSEN